MKCVYTGDSGYPCNSNWAISNPDKPGYGYCGGHARKLGLLKSKPKAQKEANKAESKARSAKTEKDKKAILLLDSKRLYHRIANDKNYDLSLLMNELKGIYGSKSAKEFLEMKKNLFVDWWISDPDTRIPETLREAASVLELKQVQVRSWMDSDDFVNDIDKKSTHSMKLVAPHVNRTVSVKALLGDDKAVEIFNKKISQEFEEADMSVLEALDKYKDEVEGGREGENVMLDGKALELETDIQRSYYESMIDEIEGEDNE
jgi:hypothetical protein